MKHKANILIVDDEPNIRSTIEGILQDEGYNTITAGQWEEAEPLFLKHKIDLALIDIWLPNISGMDILEIIKKEFPGVQVVMISGHATIEYAVKAIKIGAFDMLEKPFDNIDKVLEVIERALQAKQKDSQDKAEKNIPQDVQLIGNSPPMQEVLGIAKSAAKSNTRVLITGDNGTGKEVLAKYIHQLSDRRGKPFVALNCAAIPVNLIESELFGYEKGAFTGADTGRAGKFEAANYGTLFLDEIIDMNLETQAKVLRVLQDMKFSRLGSSKTIEVDVRVIAASNKEFQKNISENKFRQDLYFRLNVIPIHLPQLSERTDDITSLSQHFLHQFAELEECKPKRLDNSALTLMSSYSWPGNVRELQNVLERITILVEDEVITADHLRPHLQEGTTDSGNRFSSVTDPSLPYREAKEKWEKEFIMKALSQNEMNVSRTASELGIERSHLHKKIKHHNINIVRQNESS